MESGYLLEDVVKGYRWLGHERWTELNAYHPDYRQGRENTKWNAEKQAFPKVWYARQEKDVVSFVRKYGATHMVCYGINPRPQLLKNDRGFARAAKEEEIELSQNLLIDVDVEAERVSKAHIDALQGFLEGAAQYFMDLGLRPPERAYTGRGFHLLLGYPAIAVHEVPDITARLKVFADGFRDAYRGDLGKLESRIDSTHDLVRKAKIYGTAKPQVGIVSRFDGGERQEDARLREYLLALNVDGSEHISRGSHSAGGRLALQPRDGLPLWFQSLLQHDERIRALWNGAGKSQQADTSHTGYDYSLARELMLRGYRDFDDLASILAGRPEGASARSSKGMDYIKRTIANALLRT